MLKTTEVQTLVYLAETTARMHHYEKVKDFNSGRTTDTGGHTSPYHKCVHEECTLTRRTDLLDQLEDAQAAAGDAPTPTDEPEPGFGRFPFSTLFDDLFGIGDRPRSAVPGADHIHLVTPDPQDPSKNVVICLG